VGTTRFGAAIIGLAPADDLASGKTCDSDGIAVDQALLCALDIQPNVSQDYFKTELVKLQLAYYKWGQTPPAMAGGRSPLCPQIINYRGADGTPSDQIPISQVKTDIEAVSSQLDTICAGHRPNARVSYRSGAPKGVQNVDLEIEGASEKYNSTVITENYYRNRWYLADTGLRDSDYYGELDHSSEIYIDGLTGAAALPSALAAIVTLNASVQNERIHAVVRCSGGGKSIALKADPIVNTGAYATFVSDIRKAVDAKSDTCAP
jgi:hypothetical protein